jgi:hypothetical protein
MTLTKHGRRPELDALRGLFLVLMVMAHLPTQLSDWANQPLGFISAAEGFVGLSAMLVGRIYFRKLMEDEGGVRRKLWKRSLRIYGYQLILLALLFTVAAWFAVHTGSTAILNLLTFYLAHPVVGVISSMLLIYCPPLFDILPMYILFLFLTPLILSAAKRIGWRWVLAISGGVWLAAQLGLRELVDHWLGIDMHVPLAATGAFNLFAWQLVWIVGLWLGAASATDGLPLHKLTRWAFPVAVAVCCFFLGIRHGWLGPHLGQQSFGAELDKWQLGSLRVVNIAAWIVVFWQLRRYIAKALTREPLITFGQASIEVFCAHLFFVFVGLSMVAGERRHTHGPAAFVLDIVTFLALYGIAVVVVRRQKAKRALRAQEHGTAHETAVRREERPAPLLDAEAAPIRDE